MSRYAVAKLPCSGTAGTRAKVDLRDAATDLPADVIERRFAAAKAAARRSLTTTDAWAQRLAPVPGSRLEDYAPRPGDLVTHREARGESLEARRADSAKWRANRKANQRRWVQGVQ